MEEFKQRLNNEVSQLDGKINELNAFMKSEKFNILPEIERLDLQQQREAMQMYHHILLRRQSRLCS